MKSILFIMVWLTSIGIMITCNDDSELIYSQSIELENIESYHICVDTSHISCDGYCICDGLGCY